MKERPLGLNLVLSCYVANIVLVASDIIALLDIRRYRAALNSYHISEIVLALLSALVVAGLVKMKPWSRLLAICLSCVMAISGFWLYGTLIVLRLWTLFPQSAWSNVRGLLRLLLSVYVVWYLLQPKTRQLFQQSNAPPANLD